MGQAHVFGLGWVFNNILLAGARTTPPIIVQGSDLIMETWWGAASSLA